MIQKLIVFLEVSVIFTFHLLPNNIIWEINTEVEVSKNKFVVMIIDNIVLILGLIVIGSSIYFP